MATFPNNTPRSPQHLRVVLASPSDVQTEREVIATLVEDLNRILHDSHGIHIDLFRWETDARPGLNLMGGQGVVDSQMKVESSDLLLGLFWTKLGSKLSDGMTGTEHEIQKAIASNKAVGHPEIFLYFCRRPVDLNAVDLKQLSALRKFKDAISKLGLYREFDTDRDLERDVRRHIMQWLNETRPRPKAEGWGIAEPGSIQSPHPYVPEVSGVFTGREEELLEFKRLVYDPKIAHGHGRVALFGMGGVGKTQMAAHFARDRTNGFRTVLWVEAETPEAFEVKLAELAPILEPDLKDEPDWEVQAAAVRAWLNSSGNWLLVIDNAENLDRWRSTLPSHPESRILITTRQPVPSDLAASIEIAVLSEDDGALLLLRRAGLTGFDRPAGAVESGMLSDARLVSKRLGGLALALDQAGAYMQDAMLSPLEYLSDYEARGQGLHIDYEDRPHQSVRITFEQAMERLRAAPERGLVAAELVTFCAFLAPEGIPEEIFRRPENEWGKCWNENAVWFSQELRSRSVDATSLRPVISAAVRSALVRRQTNPARLYVHRLVSEVIRESFRPFSRRRWIQRGCEALQAVYPFPEFGSIRQSDALLPHALALFASLEAERNFWPGTPILFNNVAGHLRERSRYVEAEAIYRNLVSYARAKNLLKDPYVASTLNNLGLLLSTLGRFEEAEQVLKEALDIDRHQGASKNLEGVHCLDNLAGVYHLQGKHEEAEQCRREAIALIEKTSGSKAKELPSLLNNLAITLVGQERYDEAAAVHGRNVELSRELFGEAHPAYATALGNIGAMYVIGGWFDEARPWLEQAHALNSRLYEGNHLSCASSAYWLGRLHCLQGEKGLAEQHLAAAYSMQLELLGLTHPDTTNTQMWLAHSKAI